MSVKNKIGLIFLAISISCIIVSISILDKEMTDLEQYIRAILMLISGLICLAAIILAILFWLFIGRRAK